jgi:hypothetical protein
MHQIGARDEARLTADYEKCGQHCCCKNFLKVLKPVSMRSAKTQKASLDPLKISGRCGRLMCCLRYEDETYEELKKRLPRNKTRVGTTEGPGTVIDGKILVQLVLVRLDHNGQDIAVPVEELLPPDACPQPAAQPDPMRGLDRRSVERRLRERGNAPPKPREEPKAGGADAPAAAGTHGPAAAGGGDAGAPRKKRRRRRKGKGGPAGGAPGGPGAPGGGPDAGPA